MVLCVEVLAGGHKADTTALLLHLPGLQLCYPASQGSETWGTLKAGTKGWLCVLKVEETCVDKAQVLGSHQVCKAKRTSHIR